MFLLSDAEFTVPVPPAYLNGMEMLAAEEVLDSKLLTYDERLGGLLVAYEKLKFAERGMGVAQDEQPDVLFKFKVKMLLYCPKKGETFRATVSYIQDGHITLLMAGVFPIVVRAADFPKDASCSEYAPRTVVDSDGNTLVSEGDECLLKCLRAIHKDGQLRVEAAFAEL